MSLLDQLPAGDVDSLDLYAPFHDEKAAAIRRLVERLRPGRVTLAVQSGKRTVIQPDAVRRVIADLCVRCDVVEDAGERYRHGKLIEATRADGRRWTLTGSPNLSARALLLSAADGGNIEVGVISLPGTSLFPSETRTITLDEVPAVRIAGPETRRAAADVTLLAAIRTDDGLELVFARAPAEALGVLASERRGRRPVDGGRDCTSRGSSSCPNGREPAGRHTGPLCVGCRHRQFPWHHGLRHRPGPGPDPSG